MQPRLVEDVPEAFASVVGDVRPDSLALSGGSTARRCYEIVAARGLDWSAVEFWFGDERCVPVTSPDSNEGMARRVWLDHTNVGAVHSMTGAGPDSADPDGAASTYERALRAVAPLQVVHLGLGPDGHTASLFPGAPSLDVADRWVVATGDDAHPHPRLTLTFAALRAVGQIVVTVAGAEKHAALSAVRAGDARLPASRLVSDEQLAAKTVWLVDGAALNGSAARIR